MDPDVSLGQELARLGIPAVPVEVPTPWRVGSVTAYLFPDDPVTLVDATIDTPAARDILTAVLAAHGLVAGDVRRIIVTHAHSDHYGGAVGLQRESGCEVLAHEADIDMTNRGDTRATVRNLLVPLGFDDELIARTFSAGWDWRAPAFTALHDGDGFEVGSTTLRVEHHPGHTPGHVWVVEERSEAIFVGDYLLAGHPTNAGMELDPAHPSGRAPLLEQYTEGLRVLRDRGAPVLFAGHGPPITDQAELIDRRLARSERRTRHVLDGLRRGPPSTALGLGRRLYGSRPERSWQVLADVVGRLDLLVAEGRASSRLGEDGVWYFQANDT